MLQLRSLVIFVILIISSTLEGKQVVPASNEVVAMEERLTSLINDERVKQGLSPLKTWNILYRHAKEHSQNMALGKVSFGHGGFEDRSGSIMREASVESVGENVAYCYLMADPLKTAVEGWMKSSGHRKNILGDYTETAVAIAYSNKGSIYMTQLFAKKWGKN